MNRKQKMGRYHKFYMRFWVNEKCYYCGDKAGNIDHVPPIDYVYSYGRDAVESNGITLLLVSCCTNCNELLGSKALLTLDTRVVYLYGRIQKKYSSVLESRHWEQDELDQLGRTLRGYVGAHQDAHTWLERRLCYMEEIHYDVL